MITQLELGEFLNQREQHPVLDVRTPAEFEQGHIAGAINFPIFSNEERAMVGTCYKQEGRKQAVRLGFELIGNRWKDFLVSAENILNEQKLEAPVLVHCWRGGMRSASMAWALNLYGIDVALLRGGYKVYRQRMLELNQQVYPFIILGGKTGSAKTETLHALREAGEQVIDLEALAHHQGSSFGSMGNPYQPSQEQFENHLAEELSKMNLSRRIWLENESVGIGKRIIPKEIFRQMREARVIQIELPYSERLEFLNNTYGKLDPEFLTTSVLKISKRLGPNETKLSVQAIAENRIEDFIKQVLVYYDKTYERSVSNRLPETVYSLPLNTLNPVENAKAVLQLANQIR